MKSFIILAVSLLTYFNLYAQNQQICEQITINTPRWLDESKTDSLFLHFDKEVADKLKLEDLEKMWSQLEMMNGNFQNADGLKKFESDGLLAFEHNLFFENKGLKLRLAFNKENKIAGIFFVPNRTERNPSELVSNELFTETKVMIGEGDTKMEGILTVPKNATNFAIVILVHGSGLHDKNESIGPNKPFKQIAHELAAAQIASIRYNKRNDWDATTSNLHFLEETIVADVLSAVKRAKNTSGVDTNKIFLIGHSQGGMLMPMIAQKCKDVKGVILLAGNARPLEDLIFDQSTFLLSISGLTKAEKKQLKVISKQVKNVKKLSSSKHPEKLSLPLGIHYSQWMELNAYKQTEVAKTLSQPMLILQGERDYQVTMKDFNLWKEQLKTKNNVCFISYPSLNHLFCAGEGESFPEEYFVDCPIDSEVIRNISTWINTNFKCN